MKISPLTRALLYAPAKLYELGVRTRISLYENKIFKTHHLETPVISVGNLTVGGTGKTPCVAFLANFLQGEGHNVAILSRGYRRRSRGRVEVSNGKDILCGPPDAGDEPYLLANSCPGVRVVVDADRYAAGQWIEGREPVSVFILDDAFQHLRLARNLNLLLIDAHEKLDQAEMVPFGRLREPLSALQRADAVILTRSDHSIDRAALEERISKHSSKRLPIFYADHEITGMRCLNREEPVKILTFAEKRVVAVSGIARPESFIADLTRLGMQVVLRRDFPDHHRYKLEELLETVNPAREAGAEAIVTTEKDAANLPEEVVNFSGLPIYAAQIRFRCQNEDALKSLALGTITMNRS
jgi:tetraacyldisaccharide 4'-kinase